MNPLNCYMCKDVVSSQQPYNGGAYRYACRRCGQVVIGSIAAINIESTLGPERHLLMGYTRERTEWELEPMEIRSDNLKDLIKGPHIPSTPSEKLAKLLTVLAHKSEFAGDSVSIIPLKDYPLAYAKNQDEFRFLISQLYDQGLAKETAHERFTFKLALTIAGWNKAAEMNVKSPNSRQAFVAMWFTEDTRSAFEEGIDKAVEKAQYNALRVDKIEHNGKICDKIISEIRKSAFLIADFTGHRGGVYFEAGYAMGLGIPVIWLCREDEITKAHFDTRQYNHIVWRDPKDLFEKLLNRIKATIKN